MSIRRVLTPRVLRRSLLGMAVLLTVGLVVGLATVVALVRRPFPVTEGRVALPGISGQVSVQRDARGVPQIYADSPDDLFRAQGYVHAQDRFFEMDWRRHVTAGRTAEIVGDDPAAVAADRVVRTLGWRRVAEAELEQADPSTRRYLEAYARGVNDYLRGRSASQVSVSYGLLGLAHAMPPIEPWTPVDSLAWLKALAWDLRGSKDDEAERALAYGGVGDVDRVGQLYPPYPYTRHTPILPAATSRSTANTSPVLGALLRDGSVQTALAGVRVALAAVPTGVAGGGGLGSSSLVVSGSLTATGKPLLANDPHLAPGLPGVWYQVGLHCRTVSVACPFDVAGFSLSGTPGVLIGHNARIAWGLTNLGADVTDLYLEKVTGDQVERDGRLVPLTVRTETIMVAGGSSRTVTIRTGPHGPLLSDVLPIPGPAGSQTPAGGDAPVRRESYVVALAWTALAPGHSMDALLGIDAATDVAALRRAALRLDAPAQSLIYADVDGHIGYQALGRIPVRGTVSPRSVPPAPEPPTSEPPTPTGTTPTGTTPTGTTPTGTTPTGTTTGGTTTGGATPGGATPGGPPSSDGAWPLPGWTSAHDWKGYVDPAALPSGVDPADGFIVAANQAVTSSGSRAAFTGMFDYGYRSQRLRDLLSARISGGTRLTVTDLEAIQTDTRNSLATDLVPRLLAVRIDEPFYAQAVQLLRGWDGDQSTGSAAAAFFNAVWASLLELTFNDELSKGIRPDGGGRWFEVIRNLLEKPNDPWWDERGTLSVVETRDEIIKQAIIQARNRLTSTLGRDPSTWTWGRLHRLELTQTPLGTSSRTAWFHSLLDADPLELPGGTVAVDALGWDVASGTFDVTRAPSMRMVIDLGDLNRSRWVNQTGQSGHPGHDHYTDQVDAWASGRTFAWPSTPDAVAAVTKSTLVLVRQP